MIGHLSKSGRLVLNKSTTLNTINPKATSQLRDLLSQKYNHDGPKIVTTGSIVSESPFRFEDSWIKKGLHKMGFGEVNKFALRRATIFHYENCTDRINPSNFFESFHLPDTLYSFYLIVQLHVWMCQARSMKDGPEGRLLRNEILERMWQDLDVRLSQLEVYSSGRRKSLLQDLLYHHQGALFSYDEGLLTDDKTLACALWRTLFSKDDVDPRVLELSVKYVRTQIEQLKNIGSREWCLDGKFSWALFPPLITEIVPSVYTD